jgi:hypothetical protein
VTGLLNYVIRARDVKIIEHDKNAVIKLKMAKY